VPQPRAPRVQPALPPPAPLPLFLEDFSTTSLSERWRVGVLATEPATFDASATLEIERGALSITPAAAKDGAHFSGYISRDAFDLSKAAISVQLRRPADSAVTLFAAAMDAWNWVGFRIDAGQLMVESHTKGKVISHSMPFDSARHRFLRLRATEIAHIIVWETSADGVKWNMPYVETAAIPINGLRIALSAGTTKRVASPGTALFDGVTVETAP
jgi:hypothetical protein